MKKEKRVWAIVLIALGLLTPHLTIAQQDSIKSFNLGEVVITATKFPKNSSATGKVLTVIDESQLRQNAGKDLSQLLNEQVGLVISGANSNPGKDKSVYLRGAKSEYTIFLIDGVPVNDPSGAGGAFDPRLLMLDQLERIEILTGSQSTLYGSDAIAGVINLITKKSGDKKIGGNATVSYGSYDMFRASGSIRGATSIADYNIGFNHTSTTGFSEAEDVNNTGTFDDDGYVQNSFHAKTEIKIVPAWTVTPFFRMVDFDGDFDGGSFMDDNSTYTASLINPGLSSQYKLEKGAVNFLYGYNGTKRKFDGPYGPTDYNGRFNNVDLFSNYDLTKRIQVLAGINYQKLEMIDPSLAITEPHSELISPYVSFFLHDIGGFAVELGGRYNDHSKYGSNTTYSINPSYTFNNRIKLFINQSTGFKAPTLQQLYGAFGANENLKPEKSISTEVGFQAVVNKTIDVRMNYFKRSVKDIIVYTFTNGNINLNSQNDFGFEVEPNFKLGDKFNIKAYYSFVDGEVTTTENGSDSSYFNLFRRPKHTVGVNAGMQVNQKLYVSANLKTFSERKDLYFNPNNFYIAEQVSLSSYVLLDVYAEYKVISNRLKLFVDIKNALNQDYREVYGYNTMGINWDAGLSFNF